MPATATATQIHPSHRASRLELTVRLADHCAAAGITAEEAAWLPDARRAGIAQAAGIVRASAETWAEVAGILRGAESSRAAAPDPFAGLL